MEGSNISLQAITSSLREMETLLQQLKANSHNSIDRQKLYSISTLLASSSGNFAIFLNVTDTGMRIWGLSLAAKLHKHDAALRDTVYLIAYCNVFSHVFFSFFTLTYQYIVRDLSHNSMKLALSKSCDIEDSGGQLRISV